MRNIVRIVTSRAKKRKVFIEEGKILQYKKKSIVGSRNCPWQAIFRYYALACEKEKNLQVNKRFFCRLGIHVTQGEQP